MKILVEEYQYDAALVRDVLQGIDALQNFEGQVGHCDSCHLVMVSLGSDSRGL